MILSDELTPRDVETVLHRLGIEQKGNGWKTIKSPLREEKNASFGINLDSGAWKDHADGDTGDIVTLAERVLNKDNTEAIQWIKEQTDLAGALYGQVQSNGKATPPKQKKESKPFWSDDNKRLILKGQKRLETVSSHSLIEQAKEYDCLTIETLKFFGIGIIEQWSKNWLALPYDTGCQLYRRENNEKVIRSLKGSKPANSFFGSRKIKGDQKRLLIAKSPRECMLLTQLYNDSADVVGLATGEVGNVSSKQFEELTSQISKSNYSNITTILDCDSEAAEITAKSLATEISNALKSKFSGEVSYANLYEASDEKYKDVTDCVQDDMPDDSLWQIIVNDTNAVNATNATCQTIENAFKLASAPPVPAAVYDNLPKILKTRCSLFEKEYKKDVFLISALPVIAAQMPNVLAGHLDGYYTPDLFVQIVADPGTGKGAATRAKKLGHVLNEQIIAKSKKEMQDYFNLTDEQKEEVARPQLRSLYIAANSSSRGVYDTLDRNEGSGLIFENEIDTLLNATKQDWGDFSDIVRKAFHHEAISINRKDERFWIDNPRLSICLTGTFDQFKKMFESAENGHFSRYGLYTFDPERVWQSHRPTKKSRALAESVESASVQLQSMHQRLTDREEPLYIDLTDSQWQQIDDTFANKMQIIEDLDLSKHLHASNNRSAVLALRMVSIFTVLRAFEEDANRLTFEDSLTPTEADMKAAILLADNFIKHAFRLFYILPKSDNSNARGERYKKFVSMLPGEFETAEAIEIAERLEIPERTARRWLSNEENLKRIKRGHYEKMPQ
jgi:hypothetical protein